MENRVDIFELIFEEIKTLRNDLQELKRCQIQYFSLSITSTGGILGLVAILDSAKIGGLALLAPLVIILPCWLIFFDKATTITRIVGYQRILEKSIWNIPQEEYVHKGYENSLSEYRSQEKKIWREIGSERIPFKPSILGMLILKTRHRFWMINWYTFTLLSFLCCSTSYTILTDKVTKLALPLGIQIIAPERSLWSGTAFVLVILCAIYTFRMIISLTRGQNSYNGCTRIWEKVLLSERQTETKMENEK